MTSLVKEKKCPLDLETAHHVLQTEMAGLQNLIDSLDESYIAALDILSSVKGRVILCGIGKSGHIANKITATFSSTGTPAQFVHASEASHGDLGMITPEDTVVILSNSGRSAELSSIITYTKRFQIPLIAITQDDKSPLAEAADCLLIIPNAQEACPLGLAPTTSSTLMLALGDALAICLLERKGFSHDDFKIFHPGGQLGKSLIRIEDIMHDGHKMPLISEDMKVSEVLLTMTAKSFGCVGVLNKKQRLMGIITDGDLRRHMSPRLLELSAKDIMTPSPKTIQKRQLASEALHLMNSLKITSLFVTENQEPIGIIHLHDCLREGIK